jgi:hypothetical protein
LSNVQVNVNISKDGFVYTKWPEQDAAGNGDLDFPCEMNDRTFLEDSDARNQ